MRNLHLCRTALALTTLFVASSGFAANMSSAEHSAAKSRISAEFKADKAACSASTGNAKDICQEQAKAKEKVALAELEYARTGKSADAGKVAVAKADTSYSVAKEMCDDLAGDAKALCRTEAQAVHSKAIADTKLVRKVGEARNDAAEQKREADYKVAAEKCDSLAGDLKTSCMNDAKARAGKS
jgi:hypothetical protein